MISSLESILPEFTEQSPKISKAFVDLLCARRKTLIDIPFWQDLKGLQVDFSSSLNTDFTSNLTETVTIDSTDKLSATQFDLLQKIVKRLNPWRTGPFKICGLEIDSEWRSEMRWKRILPCLPNLNGMRVADVGCGNGYYIYRMLEKNPEIIIGFDPTDRCVQQFDFLNTFIKAPNVMVEPLGIEHIQILENFFDFVLCMGVMYHRRDPHTSLQNLKTSLRKGGKLLLETMVMAGEDSVCFCPPDRYMKMRNVWFMPTTKCLCDWLIKVGFTEIEVLSTYKVDVEEQRRTTFAPDESLLDFLDPLDQSKTIEGYPAPMRVIISAKA